MILLYLNYVAQAYPELYHMTRREIGDEIDYHLQRILYLFKRRQ